MFDEFFNAYLICALWSSTDEHGEPLDSKYNTDDIDEKTIEKLKIEALQFYNENKQYFDYTEYRELINNMSSYSGESLSLYSDDQLAGHDFWLTRSGHGAGFWDRKGIDLIVTKNCENYKNIDLEVGDDGKIHAL